MKLLGRFIPVVALTVALGTLGACGGGDSTGPAAGSITGIFGDSDSMFTGGTINIGFTVLNSDGFPLKGARVTWALAPATAATITPATQTSDTAGAVAASVHVGNVVGAFTASAAVNGVAPVVFHLKALDPCGVATTYVVGDTISGALARTDCKVSGFFYDFYAFDLPAGQNSIRINMTSTAFDAYVELFSNATGNLLGSDDDIQAGVIQNSQLDIILGEGGSYIIGANSFDQDTVGAYKLWVEPRATSLVNCQDAWISGAVTITDTVRTTDCSLNGAYLDRIFLRAKGGAVFNFIERSTAMNPLLKLYVANFSTQTFDSVAANDDSSAGNADAYVSYTVPGDGLYQLRVGTATAGDTGQYTLVSAPVGQASARRSQSLNEILRFYPRVKGWKAKL